MNHPKQPSSELLSSFSCEPIKSRLSRRLLLVNMTLISVWVLVLPLPLVMQLLIWSMAVTVMMTSHISRCPIHKIWWDEYQCEYVLDNYQRTSPTRQEYRERGEIATIIQIGVIIIMDVKVSHPLVRSRRLTFYRDQVDNVTWRRLYVLAHLRQKQTPQF